MGLNEKNLVILAAGIGSRYKSGVKQLQRVGPSGECIMDYSIYDALDAGFNRIVFIIRHDIQALFDEMIGNRIRRICEDRGAEMVCAYQETQDLPGGFVCPADRAKPWGTGHALLSCKGLLHGGFVVINADDYYGRDAFALMSNFLDNLPEDTSGTYGVAGFLLHNTLSDHGGVTRGLCKTDENGYLTHIRETRKIIKSPQGPCVETPGGTVYLDANQPVSMNMWAFTPDVLDKLEQRFIHFLETELHDPSSEFLIPTEISGMLDDSTAQVKVLPTPGQWFGMTYAEDTPLVRQALARMAADGIYPDPLF